MTFYTKIKILIALILAVVISLSVYNYLKSLQDEITVVIAKQDINERVFIKPEMLKEVSIRRNDKNILAPDALSSIKDIEIAISKTKIEQNEILDKENIIMGTKQALLENKVIDENSEINDKFFISNNKRIITIRLDSQGALGNKLNVGEFVDVIFTVGNNPATSFSAIMLHHIEVFDVQKIDERGGDNSQNISLVVTQQQAVDLAYAKRNGKIDLILNPIKGENEMVFPTGLSKFTESNPVTKKNEKTD